MEYVWMENYIRCLQAVDRTLRLWGVGFVKDGVPYHRGPIRHLINEVLFIHGLTHPKTRLFGLRGLVDHIASMDAEPTRDMRLPTPVVYLDCSIPVIGRGLGEKTNLTYHALLLFEVPQSYLNDYKETFLVPFMKDTYPEAYSQYDDAYGRGDIRIMGYNAEGEDDPCLGLTRLWLHHDEPPGVMELALDGYEAAQLRRFVAGFLKALERGEVKIQRHDVQGIQPSCYVVSPQETAR